MNQIKYIGLSSMHNADFIFDIPEGHDCWLFLLLHTPSIFMIENKFQEYPAGSAVLFSPNQKIYYRASGSSYSDDWIRFASDEIYVSSFPVCGIPFILKDSQYCHTLVKMIAWESSSDNSDYSTTQNLLLSILFSKLHDSVSCTNVLPYINNLQLLRKQIHNQPQFPWSVTIMAKQVQLSAGYLELIYKNQFGISCMDDVISSRILLAQDQLKYTTYPISLIAEHCGYRNIEHFYRQFKKFTGSTPSAFRHSNSIGYVDSSSP
ncbi:MAG TPA: AraC family transcriptional regulator [Lachnospiraceae bacterium]|nr:AraC family transcriptional regulator [Lachnospiraceae bacterium]